jgi:hypothetical protein
MTNSVANHQCGGVSRCGQRSAGSHAAGWRGLIATGSDPVGTTGGQSRLTNVCKFALNHIQEEC